MSAVTNSLKPLSTEDMGILDKLVKSGSEIASVGPNMLGAKLGTWLQQNTPTAPAKISDHSTPHAAAKLHKSKHQQSTSTHQKQLSTSARSSTCMQASPLQRLPLANLGVSASPAHAVVEGSDLPIAQEPLYAPKIPSPLSPYSSALTGRTQSPPTRRSQDSLRKYVLMRNLREGSANSHPRLATVLRRYERRYEPYSRARSPSVQPEERTGPPTVGHHFDNTSIPTAHGKLRPRLKYSLRKDQENALRSLLRHVIQSSKPRSRSRPRDASRATTPASLPNLSPITSRSPTPTPSPRDSAIPVIPPYEKSLVERLRVTSVDEASAAVLPSGVKTFPDSEETGGDHHAISVKSRLNLEPSPNDEVGAHVGGEATPPLVRDREPSAEAVALDDEGTDVEYDLALQAPTAQEAAQGLPSPHREREPSVTSDEGYEGSVTSNATDSTEIDQLQDDDKENSEGDTHTVPAYRQPLAVLSSPPAISSQCHTGPPIKQTQRAPRTPFLPPNKRKHEYFDGTDGGGKRPRTSNWAHQTRELSPAPERAPGWDMTKRPSRVAEQARAFYGDCTAKPVHAPQPASEGALKEFRVWSVAIRNWLNAGQILFRDGDATPNDPQTRQKRYRISLSAAMKADDGIALGVRAAKLPTLFDAGFVETLHTISKSNAISVDARWGKDAVELWQRVWVYMKVVDERLEKGN